MSLPPKLTLPARKGSPSEASGSLSSSSLGSSDEEDNGTSESGSMSASESLSSSSGNDQSHRRLVSARARRRAATAPLKRRARTNVRPRHGRSGLHSLRDNNAALSPWTLREREFEKFRARTSVLPVPESAVRVDKARGYTLHLMSVLTWVFPNSFVPASLFPTSQEENNDDDEGDGDDVLLTLGVHVSLFHALSKRFFGNTWVSPEIAVDSFQIKQDRRATASAVVRHVLESITLNVRAYFMTDLIDANCVGVVELIAYEKDRDSKATISAVGCGWTLLPLFAQTTASPEDQNDSNKIDLKVSTSGESVNVFMGSPRVLWEIPSSAWHSQPKQDQCKLFFQLRAYEPLYMISPFLRKNELVGALETVPGLKHGNIGNINMGTNAKVLQLCGENHDEATYEDALMTVTKLASLVPKSIQLEESFTLCVVASRVMLHLREEIEANLVARLKIGRMAAYRGVTNMTGEVSARVIKIALHNGRCFRSRQHTIPLKVSEQGGHDTLQCVPNRTRLKGFVFHPLLAIVVSLQYTVHFRLTWPQKLKQQALDAKKPPLPEQDVVLVTMGSRSFVPSDGKKLFLYDKHHHATALASESLELGGESTHQQQPRQRVLHVDLLSGAPCRAYTDNTLYIPPTHAGGVLQRPELSTKDSIAFVDLQLLIDGATNRALGEDDDGIWNVNTATTSESRPSSSPKRTNNQAAEHDGNIHDVGAEHWAAKILSKANANSVLAQTLNALATTTVASTPASKQVDEKLSRPSSPQKRPESPQKVPQSPSPASPVKKEKILRAVEPPLGLAPVATTELSRASKTLLTRYGFMDLHESNTVQKSPQSPNKASLKAPECSQQLKRLDSELQDTYKANEIRFHFAAYRVLSAANSESTHPIFSHPSRIYFTFQFYNFAPTRTEPLRLSNAFDNGTGGAIQTFLLMRESPANKPSLAIQFNVDTTATEDPLETRTFAEYLLSKNLYVDVWDSDSLFQIGSFAIPLRELMRQGSGIKKFQAEVEIFEPIGAVCERHNNAINEWNDIHDATGAIGNKSVVGKIQFLMSNYGHKGDHVVSENLLGSVGLNSRISSSNQLQADVPASNKVKHRVRARPMVDTNAELFQLLSREGFYGRRTHATTSDEQQRIQSQFRERSMSDATSLSPAEVEVLCDLFRSKRSDSSHRSARIDCDSTGLIALLSLKPPTVLQTKQPTMSTQVGIQKPKESTSAALGNASLHGDRLKRVLTLANANQVSLEDAFALFDANHDGFLSTSEFVQAMRSLGTVFNDVSDEDLLALAHAMDANNDGKIDYNEFGTFLAKTCKDDTTAPSRSAQWRDRLKRVIVRAMEKGIRLHHVFVQFDSSGDGNLSYDEFAKALEQLGVPVASRKPKDLQDLMIEFDHNQDGQISYVEFLQSLGFSVEVSEKETVRDLAQDLESQLREVFRRMEGKGIDLYEIFAHFDEDMNGTLSIEEFSRAVHQLLQHDAHDVTTHLSSLNETALKEFVCKINANGDDQVDYNEFLVFCGVKNITTRIAKESQAVRLATEKKLVKLLIRAFSSGMRVEDIFRHFDENADGNIVLDEFSAALGKLFHGQSLSQEELTVLSSRFDENGDGMISFSEFKHFSVEIQEKQHTLIAFFLPHMDKLIHLKTFCAKLPANDWQRCCDSDFKFSPQQMQQITPLLAYFTLHDNSGTVCLEELCSLLKTPPIKPAKEGPSVKGDLLGQLQALFQKAMAQGVNVEQCFAHFDGDGDGEITREELKEGLKKLECFDSVAEDQLNAMLQRLDEDNSGQVSLDEFRALIKGESIWLDGKAMGLRKPPNPSKENVLKKLRDLLKAASDKGLSIKACFQEFDQDKNGIINYQEFINVMKACGISNNEALLSDAIKALDNDCSGTLSIEELKRFVSSATGSQPALSVGESENGSDSVAAEPLEQNPTSASLKLRDLLHLAQSSGVDVNLSFQHFDSDGDGLITKEEFVSALKQLAGFETASDAEMHEIVNEMDKDHSGQVSLDEFRVFLNKTAIDVTTTESKSDEVVSKKVKLPKQEKTETFDPENTGDSSVPVDLSEPLITDSPNQQIDGSNVDANIHDQSLVSEKQEEAKSKDGGVIVIDSDSSETVTKKMKKPMLRSSSFNKARSTTTPTIKRANTDLAGVVVGITTGDEEIAVSETTSPSSTGASIAPTMNSHHPEQSATALSDTPPNENETKAGVIEVETTDVGGKKKPVATKKPPLRSSSFENRAKKPVAVKRGNTDPSAVATGINVAVVNEPNIAAQKQRPQTLAQARAAKMASTAAATRPFAGGSKLEKLLSILKTAQDSGVKIQVALESADTDMNGKLSYEELTSALQTLKTELQSLSHGEIVEMAKELDPMQSGLIDLQDFMRLIPEPSSTDQKMKTSDIDEKTVVRKAPPLARPSLAATKAAARQSTAKISADIPKPDSVAESTPQEGTPLPSNSAYTEAHPAIASSSTVAESPQEKILNAIEDDCDYAFSSDPKIRAVELKLRKAAVDAYARGILPLRVINKFLGEEDKRNPFITPSIPEKSISASRKKRKELLRVEFLQVLMELGLSLISDKNLVHNGGQSASLSGGGMGQPVTRMNDHLYARQLERLSRYKHHIAQESKAQRQLVRAMAKTKKYPQTAAGATKGSSNDRQSVDSLRRFAEEKNQLLRVLSYYRDGHKKSLVYSLLRDQVTTRIALFPSFASLLFLELPFQNPYNHHDRFRLELQLPSGTLRADLRALVDMEIVRDSEEWKFYRQQVPMAYGDPPRNEDDMAVEKEMIDDQNEIVMDAHDRIVVPLRFRWLGASGAYRHKTSSGDRDSGGIPISMTIKSCSHGHTVALYQLDLQPQPFVCHRVLRFSHPAGSVWRWRLRCPFGKFVVCMDPSVVIECIDGASDDGESPAYASFKCRIGAYPSVHEFYVVLYEDKYYARVFEMWQIRIQSKIRLDLHAVLGQTVTNELVIKGDLSSSQQQRHVQCFTSAAHRHLIGFRPSQVFSLVPNAFNRIEFQFCCADPTALSFTDQQGGSALRLLVNLVDVDTHELVGAWTLHVAMAMPTITKTYELQLRCGQPAQKKISYANPWDEPQTIHLRSSAPDILKPRDALLQIAGHGQVFLRLWFAAVTAPVQAKHRIESVYLFINDRRTDQIEECLLFHITYE